MLKIDINLIKRCYKDYANKLEHYDKINRYYYGNTDSCRLFKPRLGRSNLKINTNFMQKLVDEEAQYSFGNMITYTSKDNNKEVVSDIEYALLNNKCDYDINLARELINFGIVFEINYINKYGKFKNKKVSPLNGYAYIEDEEVLYFLHIYKKQLDNKDYIDVYTNSYIFHFDETFIQIAEPTPHYFGIVPVGYGIIGGKEYNENKGYVEGDKTIYRTIKTLQDSYETNFGDIVSEISDFRNAILKMYGIELEDKKDEKGNVILDKNGQPLKKEPLLRDNAILYFGDKAKEDAEWLTKNINDTFIKNTRDDIKDLIYTLTSHIDSNEKMQSNLSGVALRSRLQTLEAKCKDNQLAFTNIIYTRLRCLFKYLYLTQNKTYDANLIKIEFTPNVPQDIVSIAQIVSQVPHDVMSNRTKRSMFPNISNVDLEGKQVDLENKAALPEVDLDKEVI